MAWLSSSRYIWLGHDRCTFVCSDPTHSIVLPKATWGSEYTPPEISTRRNGHTIGSSGTGRSTTSTGSGGAVVVVTSASRRSVTGSPIGTVSPAAGDCSAIGRSSKSQQIGASPLGTRPARERRSCASMAPRPTTSGTFAVPSGARICTVAAMSSTRSRIGSVAAGTTGSVPTDVAEAPLATSKPTPAGGSMSSPSPATEIQKPSHASNGPFPGGRTSAVRLARYSRWATRPSGTTTSSDGGRSAVRIDGPGYDSTTSRPSCVHCRA